MQAVGPWGSTQRQGRQGLSFAVCRRAVQALRSDVGLPQMLLPQKLCKFPDQLHLQRDPLQLGSAQMSLLHLTVTLGFF